MAQHQPSIVWNLPQASIKLEDKTNSGKYNADIANTRTALQNVRGIDQALQGGESVLHLNEILDCAQPINVLAKSLNQRCAELCGLIAGDAEDYITFIADHGRAEGDTGTFCKLLGEESWTRLRSSFNAQSKGGVSKEEAIRVIQARSTAINQMPDRSKVKFRFVITFEHSRSQAHNFDWRLWAEVITHELCIHVEGALNMIERYRAGLAVPWETINDDEHFLFRTRGVPRYPLWLSRLDRANAGLINHTWIAPGKGVMAYAQSQSAEGGQHVRIFYEAMIKLRTDQNAVLNLRMVDVLGMVNVLPLVDNWTKKLVADTKDKTLVDVKASQSLLDQLKVYGDKFLMSGGNTETGYPAWPIQKHFWWWPGEHELSEYDAYRDQ